MASKNVLAAAAAALVANDTKLLYEEIRPLFHAHQLQVTTGWSLNRLTVFPCHARQDRQFVRDLADFLERGANLELFVDDGEIRPGETLISKAADGLQADVILVILSSDSVPARWVREEWTSAFWRQPEAAEVQLACVLYRDCAFPGLLRRRNFFDLTLAELRPAEPRPARWRPRFADRPATPRRHGEESFGIAPLLRGKTLLDRAG